MRPGVKEALEFCRVVSSRHYPATVPESAPLSKYVSSDHILRLDLSPFRVLGLGRGSDLVESGGWIVKFYVHCHTDSKLLYLPTDRPGQIFGGCDNGAFSTFYPYQQ